MRGRGRSRGVGRGRSGSGAGSSSASGVASGANSDTFGGTSNVGKPNFQVTFGRNGRGNHDYERQRKTKSPYEEDAEEDDMQGGQGGQRVSVIRNEEFHSNRRGKGRRISPNPRYKNDNQMVQSGNNESDISMFDANSGGGGFEVLISVGAKSHVSFKEDRIREDFMEHLKKISRIPVIFSSFTLLAGNRLKLNVASLEMKNALLDLNGIRYSREKIFITASSSNQPGGSKSLTEKLTCITNSLNFLLPLAFDASKGVLMLDNVDSKVSDGGIDLNSRRQVSALFDAISRQSWANSVTALSLANCNISSLRTFHGIWDTALPSLIRVNLSGNGFRSLSDIFPSSSSSSSTCSLFKRLVQIILKDTPLQSNYYSSPEKMQIYFLEIMKNCPSCQIIDERTFSPEEKVQMAQNAEDLLLKARSFVYASPMAVGPFFDQESTQSTVYAFINKFFSCYDQQRMSLLDAYHESSSLFSLSLACLPNPKFMDNYGNLKYLDLKHRAGITPAVLKQWNTRFPDLGKYQVGYNRPSLNEIEPYQDFIKTNSGALVKGSRDILQCQSRLPSTKHVESSLIVDSFQYVKSGSSAPPTLCLYINGEFREAVKNGEHEIIRSFGRNLVLIPNNNPNWPVSIINDNLIIYNFANARRKTISYDLTPMEIERLSLNPQKDLIARFSMATGLNVEFAEQCLSDNNWQENKAFKAFQYLNQKQGFKDSSFIRK